MGGFMSQMRRLQETKLDPKKEISKIEQQKQKEGRGLDKELLRLWDEGPNVDSKPLLDAAARKLDEGVRPDIISDHIKSYYNWLFSNEGRMDLLAREVVKGINSGLLLDVASEQENKLGLKTDLATVLGMWDKALSVAMQQKEFSNTAAQAILKRADDQVQNALKRAGAGAEVEVKKEDRQTSEYKSPAPGKSGR